MSLKLRIGGTPLLKNARLSKEFGLVVMIKDESRNPFGTYKDRRSAYIVRKAMRAGVGKLVLITAGNAGYSLARIAEGTGIKVVCVIDSKLKRSIKRRLKVHCHRIIELDLRNFISRNYVINLARERNDEEIWEVDSGFSDAYADIVKEVKRERPDYIVVPVATGEAFIGIHKGIRRYGLRTELVGVTSKNRKRSMADKLATLWPPSENDVGAVAKRENAILMLTEKEIGDTYAEFRRYVDCEPSSSVVLAALHKLQFPYGSKVILINSGRGLV